MNRGRMGGISERGERGWNSDLGWPKVGVRSGAPRELRSSGGSGGLYFAGSSLNFWPMAVTPVSGKKPVAEAL